VISSKRESKVLVSIWLMCSGIFPILRFFLDPLTIYVPVVWKIKSSCFLLDLRDPLTITHVRCRFITIDVAFLHRVTLPSRRILSSFCMRIEIPIINLSLLSFFSWTRLNFLSLLLFEIGERENERIFEQMTFFTIMSTTVYDLNHSINDSVREKKK